MHELSVAGWADPEIGRVVRRAQQAWADLVTEVARRHAADLGGYGPLSPEDVGALVVDAFIGAESLVLTGLESGGVPVRSGLRRVGELLRAFVPRKK